MATLNNPKLNVVVGNHRAGEDQLSYLHHDDPDDGLYEIFKAEAWPYDMCYDGYRMLDCE